MPKKEETVVEEVPATTKPMTRRELREVEKNLLKGRLDGFTQDYKELVIKWGVTHAAIVESVQIGNGVWGQTGKLVLMEVEVEEEADGSGSDT